MRSLLSALALAVPMALLTAGVAGCTFNGDGGASDSGIDGFATGQDSALSAGTSSQDFGTVSVGAQSASAVIVVTDTGAGTTGSLAVALAGASADSFGIDADGCTGQVLGGGAGCTIHVHFAPRGTGAKGATLTVSGAPGGSTSVALSGQGAGAGNLSMTPGTKDFGAIATGATSQPATFTLTNGDGASTGAVTLALTGADKGEFQLASDGCSGKPLAGKATCTVALVFAPGSVGNKTATLTATAAGLTGTATASLSGSAAPPASFVVKPAQFDFGAVVQGSPTAEQTFTVTNTGGSASGTASVALSGPDAADFAITTNDCTAPVPQGGSCTFGLRFTATAAKAESATVEVKAGSLAPVSVKVGGTGLAPAAIVLSPSTQALGSLAQGSAGADAALVVTNNGGVPTGPLAVTLGGSNADQFGLGADGCTGQALAATGGSCTVNVHFAPTTTGTLGNLQASLQVSGTPGGTTASTLTGTAVAPATLVLGTTSQGFGTVVEQQSSGDFPFTVTNTGGVPSGPLTASLGGANVTQFGVGSDGCSNQPLAAAATCTMTVHFTPDATALGLEQATLTVSATPGGSPVATLTGTAAAPAALVLSPTSYPFGKIVQGSTSADASFTVTNGGGVSTGVLGTSLGGTNAGQFGLGSDGCSGQTLAPGATCVVKAHFSPSLGTLGTQQATLTVSGTPGGSGTTNLIGTAATPLGVSPAAQAFGTAAFGSPSGAIPFVVSNASAVAVGPLTVSLQGTDASQFQLDAADPCAGATLAAGGSCTVHVTLSPTSGTTGPMAAVLSVSAGTNTAQIATLTGTAVASATLAFGGPSQSLGTVVQQKSSGEVPLTVTNSGGVPSGVIGAAALGGTDVAQFGVGSDGCAGKTLAPAATCVVAVHFTPGTGVVGPMAATLSLAATPGGSPSIALSGTALAPAAIGISPTTFTFADAMQGASTGDTTFTVTNGGGVATGTLTATLPAGAFRIGVDGCTGTTVAANGGTCLVTAHFAPPLGALGSQQATLTVTDGAGGSAPASLIGNATTPLGITAASAGFGNAAYQSPSPPVTFTVANGSPAAVGPLSIALQGSDAAQFKLGTNGCNQVTLPGGGAGSCTVAVTLSPTASALPSSVSVTVVASAGVNTAQQLSLGGAIVNPATLSFNTGSQSFGTVVQNGTSGDIPLTVTNGGDVDSGTLATSPLGGTSPSLFGLGADTCNGKKLAAKASCQVNVHFTPGASAPGGYAATLTVGGVPGGSPSVGLSGTAVKPAALTVSSINSGPSSSITWSFGQVPQGSKSAVATFTVANSGGVDTGTLLDTIGGGPLQVVADGCNGKPLAAGSTCTIQAQFAPPLGLTGQQAATITISAGGGPGGSASVNLQGQPIAPLTINPVSQPFGNAAYGSPTGPAVFTVTNTGATAIGPLAVTVSNPTVFPVSSDGCSQKTLAGGGATCQVSLVLAPTANTSLGGVTATLGVDGTGTTATNSPAQATLSGTVVRPAQVVLSPPSGFNGFGTVLLGTSSADVTFTATNTGAVPTGALAAAVLGGSSPGQFTIVTDGCNGAVLAPGSGSCPVVAHFHPLAAGLQQATLTVAGSPGGSALVNLSGTGQTPTPSIGISPTTSASSPLVLGTKYANGAGTLIDATDQATFTITNSGTAATGTLAISMTSTVTTAPWFFVNDGCSGKVVQAKSACTLDVQFAPHQFNVGPNDVAVTVTDPSSTSVMGFASGIGLNQAGTLVIAPATTSFGSVSISSGGSSVKTLTVTNYGVGNGAGLTDILISPITGLGYDFQYQNPGTTNCPLGSTAAFTTLQSCSFTVTFKPSANDPSSVAATLLLKGRPGGTGPIVTTAQSNLAGTALP